MKEANTPAGLVEVRAVSVDAALQREDRITEYVRQLKDPHHFLCGKFNVTIKHLKDGPTLEECLYALFG